MPSDPSLSDFRRELDGLATLRDELKRKTRMSRADLRNDLNELAYRWDLVDAQVERVRAHVERDVARMKKELKVLVGDLKRGFDEVKRAIEN